MSISSRRFTLSKLIPRSRTGRLAFVATTILALGCSQETPLVVSEAQAESPVAQQAEQVPPQESATQSYSQKLAAALEKAAAAKDAVVDQLSAAGESGSEAANDSITWATDMFNNLKEQGLTQAENTQQWLSNDWKLAGAWEYRVVEIGQGLEATETLNRLGSERWECFHVTSSKPADLTVFYFKRPAQSYLNNLPMKDLMHLLPLMGAGGNDNQ